MSQNRDNYYELETQHDNWIRVFDLPGVAEKITDSPCNGAGTCGKCRVIVLHGDCTPATEEEKYWLSSAELEQGIRLACFCQIKGEIILRFSNQAVPQYLLTSAKENICPDPVTRQEIIRIPAADTDIPRLQQLQEVSGRAVDAKSLLAVLRVLGETKDEDPITMAIHNNQIIRISKSNSAHNLYGIAFDLGTTSVVGSLFNMEIGKEMNTVARLNPQCTYGFDVMSRLDFASRPGGTERLQRCILDCLDDITVENCTCCGIEANGIEEIAVTGNAVMLHLLTGVNPSAMGYHPYRPVFTSAISLTAGSLGLKAAQNAAVFLMPSASAFIGSDIVSGILAISLDQENANVLLMDMGTNGEMALFSNNSLLACSVALGPALEGMNIECGMRAEEGAVDQVWLENEKLCLHIIGEGQARGLCGSGLIDAVGVLWKNAIVAANGRMLKPGNQNANPAWLDRITETEKGRRFWLIPPCGQEKGLYISQKDIRQLQLAKGAIGAVIKVLLETAGIKVSEVHKVNLAGALGNYVDAEVLIELGIFPLEWRGKMCPVGNTALQGASMALMSAAARKRANQISSKLRCLDLTSCQAFQRNFIGCMSFGSTGWTSAEK